MRADAASKHITGEQTAWLDRAHRGIAGRFVAVLVSALLCAASPDRVCSAVLRRGAARRLRFSGEYPVRSGHGGNRLVAVVVADSVADVQDSRTGGGLPRPGLDGVLSGLGSA